MKTTGHYDQTTSEYDIDHEINLNVDKVKTQCETIEESYTANDAKMIFKAIIAELLNRI